MRWKGVEQSTGIKLTIGRSWQGVCLRMSNSIDSLSHFPPEIHFGYAVTNVYYSHSSINFITEPFKAFMMMVTMYVLIVISEGRLQRGY